MNFSNKYFKKDDQYFTSKDIWQMIEPFIPKDAVICAPFYSKHSKSPDYLRELGFEVVSENIDFHNNNLGDIIVTNPPFSDLKKIMIRLYEINKPFILIVPISKICCKYMKLFKNKIQIIIPKSRINFIKCDLNGEIIDQPNKSNFDSIFLCYKMNLSSDIVFL